MNLRRVLVASAIAHFAVFALVLRMKAPLLPAPIEVPVAEHEEATIDLTAEPVTATAATNTAPVQFDMGPVAAWHGAARVAEATATTPEVLTAPDSAPYGSNSTWVVGPGPSLGISGTGQINPFLGRSGTGTGTGTGGEGALAGDPMYVPPNKRAEQSVKDALRAKDQSIGLGLEGPVVHALEDATHAGFGPERGNATFLAVIDERGIVIDLKILTSNAKSADGAKGWEAVRQRAVKSLATAKIELRGVKRAELTIAVDSDIILPSGNKPGAPIKPTGTPTQTKIISNAPPSPGGADNVASVEVAQFDVTDIGAKEQRVVHAKLVLMTTR